VTTTTTAPSDLTPPSFVPTVRWFRRLARPRDAAALVATAATRLDVAAPGWADRLDWSALDLADPRRCVLAQLFGDYGEGLHRLYGARPHPRDAYAFTSYVGEDLWYAAATARRTEATA
jgi:hypothetical protein